MDNIHRITEKSWINQNPILIRDFIASCRGQFIKVGESKDSDEEISAFESCLHHLSRCDPSQSIDDVLDEVYGRIEPLPNPIICEGTALASTMKSLNEAVISVRFLRSQVNLTKSGKPTLTIQPEYDVEVLSSQLLSDLRSAIRCENSASVPFCEEKSVVSQKSGFFFIENTFYNDTSAESVDYSRVIREWAENRNTGIDQLNSMSLENVKFNDLTIRLGCPYLYRHMGDCEHLLVFQWLRMWNPHIDRNTYSSYPRVSWTKSKLQEKCAFCTVNAAKFKVKGHPDLPSSCVLLCPECLQLFCQKKESLVGVTIEPYLDKSILFG